MSEPRTFGYCRASTAKQVDSPDNQKAAIKRYVEYMGLGEVSAYFIDAAKSGKTDLCDREAGAALMRVVRAGDNVVISKLDRAFRSAKNCAIMMDQFQRLGIRIHFCDMAGGSVDLSSPMGRFLIQILAAVAELERATISERTKDGLANKKKKGVKHTRHPGYGFTWVKQKNSDTGKTERVRAALPEEREVMKSIVTWRMLPEPFSWEHIEEHLKRIGIVTKDTGKPWSQMRIRRACLAELRLMVREGRAKP